VEFVVGKTVLAQAFLEFLFIADIIQSPQETHHQYHDVKKP
jgi:tRNA A37 threonylcarbamoyladenosine biosynthesis protein TsaE